MYLRPVVAVEWRRYPSVRVASTEYLPEQRQMPCLVCCGQGIKRLAECLAPKDFHQQRRVVGKIVLAGEHLFFGSLHGAKCGKRSVNMFDNATWVANGYAVRRYVVRYHRASPYRAVVAYGYTGYHRY